MPSLTESEFQALLADESKTISGDIVWSEDEDHSPALEFLVPVESESGYPLFVRGSYNPRAQALSYLIMHRPCGRIYALDLGKDHRNPNQELIGEKHKHAWSEVHRDRQAYVPEDITATAGEPVAVWDQFCKEAKIRHNGNMSSPVPPPTLFQ